MPELPEVEVIRRGLAEHVVGQVIAGVDVRGTRTLRRQPGGADALATQLTGARVVRADRRGKYLWLVAQRAVPEPGRRQVASPAQAPGSPDLGGADDTRDSSALIALIVHLGMSGQLLVESAEAPREKHAHVVFELTPQWPSEQLDSQDLGSIRQLRFVDQRTFGRLELGALTAPTPGHDYGIPVDITHIAPDPLEAAFDIEAVTARIRRSRSGIKRLLLDQRVLSGVGNIYADESLWRARIHGERPGESLANASVHRLLTHAAEVMEEALHAGGTSFDALYVDVAGDSGYFARSLAAYGRAGQPCPRCGGHIIRETFMNRGSFSCPHCQRNR